MNIERLNKRFWSHVTKTESGCWEWKGCRIKGRGYGIVKRFVDGKKKYRKVHRVAYELAIGPVPEGLMVCHHCDNPPCINPEHLFAGTGSDNMSDCVKKGRYKSPAKAKLPKDVRMEVRRLAKEGKTQMWLANKFGVSQTTIWRTKNGYKDEKVK